MRYGPVVAFWGSLWTPAMAVLTLSSTPALVSAPVEAFDAALAAPKQDALSAAETLVLIGDPRSAKAALDLMRRGPVAADAPRRARLVARALVTLRDERLLLSTATSLSSAEGWQANGTALVEAGEDLKRRRLAERVGLGLFALGLAVLSLGGARALIAVRSATLQMGGATVIAVLLTQSALPRGVPLVALLGSGFVVLAHAAASAVDRTRPDARGRLLACALVGIGALGLLLAAWARLSTGGFLALVSTR